ncbi:hypothetical protein CK910_03915 [Aeromonas sp. CA23]|uniref:hypothetical protein n=1 Tax=Aeromonas sp. CA23 TaxID=2033032 RepID=UPI000BFB93F8|nr:hypothetical protein [Aeromonas sp. CA23]ATL97743.1 hypothetical protein CK910_03915 [Aeromonas sp. CA23]
MSPLQLIDDLLDFIDCITDFPRYWRVYVGIVATTSAGMAVASLVDSPEKWGSLYWVIGIVGVGLTIFWQQKGGCPKIPPKMPLSMAIPCRGSCGVG